MIMDVIVCDRDSHKWDVIMDVIVIMDRDGRDSNK